MSFLSIDRVDGGRGVIMEYPKGFGVKFGNTFSYIRDICKIKCTHILSLIFCLCETRRGEGR